MRRQMRADAEQNRADILRAAWALFEEHGTGVSLRAIAAEAGVGIATLYRSFPTRDDLLLALAMQATDEGLAAMDCALECWDEDPEAAWHGFVRSMAGARVSAFLVSLGEENEDFVASEKVAEVRAERLARLEVILTRARDAGLVGDIDAMRFMAGIAAATRPLPPFVEESIPDLHEWLVDVYLQGLRP
ncbi:AcrR family transcriptional regulator [Pseudoglutamicibacter albus]|uniref:AcrR family transcriptional regulator n=1 Tax=Pseudoglutamicibacter albus TaxID=98671 RepID=A0ABU1YXA2_9MICC|nr:helix-turn-helix domain-containing protein [Pseudoglutamicibacter albus]MDR7292853.1 AcrR family transcriptional regulator [Pseudoglutamicibacter albus]